jgi:hypothetical protein
MPAVAIKSDKAPRPKIPVVNFDLNVEVILDGDNIDCPCSFNASPSSQYIQDVSELMALMLEATMIRTRLMMRQRRIVSTS